MRPIAGRWSDREGTHGKSVHRKRLGLTSSWPLARCSRSPRSVEPGWPAAWRSPGTAQYGQSAGPASTSPATKKVTVCHKQKVTIRVSVNACRPTRPTGTWSGRAPGRREGEGCKARKAAKAAKAAEAERRPSRPRRPRRPRRRPRRRLRRRKAKAKAKAAKAEQAAEAAQTAAAAKAKKAEKAAKAAGAKAEKGKKAGESQRTTDGALRRPPAAPARGRQRAGQGQGQGNGKGNGEHDVGVAAGNAGPPPPAIGLSVVSTGSCRRRGRRPSRRTPSACTAR